MRFLSRVLALGVMLFAVPAVSFSATPPWSLTSPDGRIKVEVKAAGNISYSITFDDKEILSPSFASMTLAGGEVLGAGAVKSVRRGHVEEKDVPATAYRNASVDNVYNWLVLGFKDCSVEFRAFDNAVAYRFRSAPGKGGREVVREEAEINFPGDWTSWVPYVNTTRTDSFETQFGSSFENYYEHPALSAWNPKRLAFMPVVVDAEDGVKVLLTESDLRDYPGMFLSGGNGSTLRGIHAPYPKTVENVGLRGLVREREDFIAKGSPGRTYPWRIIGVFEDEVAAADCDLVWQLASPADRNVDWSWVKPGKVAWDWWCDKNIFGVDFPSGMNTGTYKYFIDFASRFGIEYVILDGGWTDSSKYDLFAVVPQIDLEELVRYGEKKGVGLILWGCYTSVAKDLERAFEHYSGMGIKGFKVDFLDRDDQLMTGFMEEVARTAAKYHLLIDFHGVSKPAGLERTYPNIINYEGVAGLEQMKWGADQYDQVTYDVTIPFVRMAAGRMDYTQGAMINCTKGNASSNNSTPMSQGTRCHQLAEYVVFDSPLAMLCDSPSRYLAEPGYTSFLSGIPTVWDETAPLAGKIGEYVAIARRKGSDWYVGVLNGWEAREVELDLGFIQGGGMTVFQDGINAAKAAQDYKTVSTTLPSDGKITVRMAPGGGWVAKITI